MGDLDTWRKLLIGTWQNSSDWKPHPGGYCVTFTPEGKFVVKFLHNTLLREAVDMVTGDGSSGRWEMRAAADQVVLQLHEMGFDTGLLGRVYGPFAKPAFFVLGRLHPPREYRIISIGKDRIELRERPRYYGRKEIAWQWMRRSDPM